MKTVNKELYQVRIYELFDYNKQQFLVRFRDHASRIMKKYDFNILYMWETNHNGKPEFVYLLKWKNEDDLKEGWKKFFADEEWDQIKDQTTREYGNMVGEIEDRILQHYYIP